MAQNQETELERAIQSGRETAEENLKADKTNGSTAAGYDREDIVEDAQKTAKLNHKADLKNNEGLESDGIPKNDTSKEAKEATAKAQLDPTGNDPISSEEINKSATNASMDTGNKNGLTDKENAKRATNPGEAEEKNSFSIARDGVTQDLQSKTVTSTGDKSTSNKNPEKANKS